MGKNLVEIIITAEDKASGVIKGITGTLGTVGRMATGAALGGLGVLAGGLALAGRSAIDMNSQLETSTLQFETLMGDSDRAAEHVASLFDFAAKTPFETGPIIEASRLMQVFGGDALNTEENLTRVGDTAAAVGAPIEDIGFWVGRAYAAIQGGQPFGEAAQNLMQMGAVSPQVVAEMNRLKEAGASSDEIFAVLQGHMDAFSGAMEKQAGTWEGLKSTIIDSLNLAAAVALKPFFDLVKSGMAQVAAWLNSPEVQTGIQSIVAGFTQLIASVSAFVVDQVIPFVQQHGKMLQNVLIGLGVLILATVIPAVVSLAISMAPVILVIAAITAVVALLRTAWEENWGGIQEKVASVIGFIRPLIEGALAGIRAFWEAHGAAILAAAQQAWQMIQTAITTVITVISTIVTTVLTAIQTFWQAHGAAILATATQFWNLIKGLIDGVVNQIKLIVDAFRLAFQGDWEAFGAKLFEIWQNAWNTVVNFLSGLWGMVLPWLSSLFSNIVGWFTSMDWGALGRRIIDGIVGGLRAAGSAIRDVLMGFAQSAWQAVMDFFTGGGGTREGRAPARSDKAIIGGRPLIGGPIVSSGRSTTAAGAGQTTVVNIDARGSARGVDRDLRAMVEQVMREYGARADIRVRTT